MSGAYLPGDTRQRIQDLIKDSSITQAASPRPSWQASSVFLKVRSAAT